MDAAQTHRIATVQDQIWLLNMRTQALRDEVRLRPAGSQSRVDAEKELVALRAEIRGLVRERRGRV